MDRPGGHRYHARGRVRPPTGMNRPSSAAQSRGFRAAPCAGMNPADHRGGYRGLRPRLGWTRARRGPAGVICIAPSRPGMNRSGWPRTSRRRARPRPRGMSRSSGSC